ncbi:MAG: hypothetical protein ABR567_08190 [Myxococcales bacterium]
MALNVVLVPQRQSPNGMALSWNSLEGVSAYQIFVAQRRMTPEEIEAAATLNGTDDCFVAKVGAEVSSIVDDITPQGEARHYGVAMIFDDGSVKAARFRAVPDGGAADSFHLSAVKMRMTTGSYRIKPPPAAAASTSARAIAAPPSTRAAAEDPLEARKRAQREARAKAAGEAPATAPETPPARAAPPPAPAPAPAEEDPVEARKRAQREARERAAAGAPAPAAPAARSAESREAPSSIASAEPPPQPATVPLSEPIDIRMQGATQTWDGLRIYWDREPRAAAYEIIASDHQIFGDELADALAGKADFTTAAAVAASVTCVLDNVTPRDSRGWYAVLVRHRDGKRAPHPFRVGDAATSGKTSGPFLNPNRTGEVRAEVEGLLADAREQWDRWKKEQDGGSRREAKRMVGDALLIWPDYPAAKKLQAELT